ncbi:hypothetical protein P2H44_14735 [Albimonas sp. CAU 1670]|uniref:hypothetical protein n=1 Tax=Albimonas sp. CAU 1670 TaxID=3032599 RepID=UPI0023DC804F|nr:hypothetical protein [Albimonas sp. CAU 1670]MDF2233814.1 hypothetical protein [Albimonas sp. CAU 1670]
MIRTTRSAGWSAALLLGAVLLAGCSGAPVATEARSTTVSESVASVESIDRATRQAVLVADDGERMAVTVDPAAGPLDEVSAGDLVQVVVVDRAVARLASPEEMDAAALVATVVGQREGRPARDGLLATRQIVEVVEVTAPGDTVRYRDADGEVHTITVEKAENRAFARSLSRGDEVVIDMVATVAISTIGQN